MGDTVMRFLSSTLFIFMLENKCAIVFAKAKSLTFNNTLGFVKFIILAFA
jgi:hypothetical protein